jgi:hypothetical protein
MVQDLDGSLTIKEVIDSDEGKYQCVAKNFAGSRTSAEGFLLMQGKNILILLLHRYLLWYKLNREALEN